MKRLPEPEPRHPKRGLLSLALTVLLVSISGVLLWSSPFGKSFERQYGLELAFWLRGERPPPSEAVYIPLDQNAANNLCPSTPVDPKTGRSKPCKIDDLPSWARPYVADLIDALAAAGASVIVVDLKFLTLGTPVDDEKLAAAIKRAGNVLLLSDMEQRDNAVWDGDQLFPPQPLFEMAATATAPMPLPRDARRDRFVTFVPVAGRRLATLPSVALYLFQRETALPVWQQCRPLALIDANLGPDDVLEQLRQAFRDDPQAIETWESDSACADFLRSAIGRVLTSGEERYFNFYRGLRALRGPPIDVVVADSADWRPTSVEGRVVFIGVDDHSNRSPEDSHLTAVGDSDFSGVELVTTAFANLLHDQDLEFASVVHGVLVTFAAMLLTGLLFVMPSKIAFIGAIFIAWVYIRYSAYRFEQDDLIVPMVIPLFVMVPLMVALGWRWQLGRMEQLVEVLSQFVPSSVKDWWRRARASKPQRLFGVCMHTDVAGYTTLSETLASNPIRQRELEREYWRLVDAEIVREHGRRFEIAGDGMLCVWATEEPDAEAATRACRAAIAIHRVVGEFNQRYPDTPFPTRIGLHAGIVTIGPVGGGDSYTMTVGGDVPNTAARIENDLNKQLGTRLLVSEDVAKLLRSSDSYPLGEYSLRGKKKQIFVYALSETWSGHHSPYVRK